jgi:uncharacterized membrane protein (UPF0127 family)
MIRNKTQNIQIVSQHKELYGVIEQSLGLMFRKQLKDTGWVFILPYPARWDVTNLFVFQSIDVLWLDVNRKVHQITSMKPFTPAKKGKLDTRYLVELPLGTAESVRIGDVIEWNKKAL